MKFPLTMRLQILPVWHSGLSLSKVGDRRPSLIEQSIVLIRSIWVIFLMKYCIWSRDLHAKESYPLAILLADHNLT